MALISCAECEKQISDKAKSCPNCGCPIKNYTKPLQGGKEWTAKLLAKTKHEIAIRLELTKETHQIEYKIMEEVWSKLTVKVDGEITTEQQCSLVGEFITGYQKVEFIIADGEERYQAIIIAQHSTWGGKIKRLSLVISNFNVYDEFY